MLHEAAAGGHEPHAQQGAGASGYQGCVFARLIARYVLSDSVACVCTGANILVTKDHVVKIADFGLARRMLDPKTLLRMGACNMRLMTKCKVVTAWWRPPEIFLGDDKYGASVDMWSVGAVLGELLAGACSCVLSRTVAAAPCALGYLQLPRVLPRCWPRGLEPLTLHHTTH